MSRLSVLFTSLFFCLVLAFPFYANAHFGGLMQGKVMTSESSTPGNLRTWDTSSNFVLQGSNANSKTDSVWYEFNGVATINSYQLNRSPSQIEIVFYDSMDQILWSSTTPSHSGGDTGKVSIPAVSNVKKIMLNNIYGAGITLYNFDVFGEEVAVTKPTPPADLKATLMGEQVSLSWGAVNNATSYHVRRSVAEGGPYTTIATNVTSNAYVDNITSGSTYYYVITAVNAGGQSANSNEIAVSFTRNPTLDIVIAEDEVKVGQEISANVMLRNVVNIYAEDFTVNYDNSKFEFIGFEEVLGYKVYNTPVDQNGQLRFIVASQGQEYGITGETTLLKLKLKAKAEGMAKVDAQKCRIADTQKEFDLPADDCGEDSLLIEGFFDVNRSGEYTLLDLAIDAYYYGQLASSTPTSYNTNQSGDERILEEDLQFIVTQLLENNNYPLNM
ncbi:cohesin domain-containing protein [Paenibacillus sp. YYML68]|uniref:cohesin domain-containing protein n=1 Tax=Paenibacillus sp. YYML68 TaxID=2909250 RepID=UPI0024928311|nr:cohesin domain-containing protein [Paenibacillus sp. YYML68]